jgi:HlyD family secretion protein
LEDEEFRARVTEAQGQLNSLKARLAALENGSRPEEKERSKADLEQVRADLENARVTLNRTRSLVEQGVMSKQTLDDAQARYDAQVARFASYEKTNALVGAGPRREDIDAMRAQVKQAEGTLTFAQTQLDNTVISAPISGAILERNVERGEFVTTGFVSDRGAKGYVVSMADLTDLQVELDIDQKDFARLGPRQPAVLTTDTYPDRKYQGEIIEISPEANRQKATVQVKVKVLKPDEYLRPEMNASVAFYSPEKPGEKAPNQTSAAKPIITIPSSTVRDGAVFMVVDGRAVRRQIQVSGTSQQGATISNGLIGGEDLIVNPPADLKDGQKVRPKS